MPGSEERRMGKRKGKEKTVSLPKTLITQSGTLVSCCNRLITEHPLRVQALQHAPRLREESNDLTNRTTLAKKMWMRVLAL